MNYIIVITLWAFFGLQHSYLARPVFKEKVKKYLGLTFEKYFYRFLQTDIENMAYRKWLLGHNCGNCLPHFSHLIY